MFYSITPTYMHNIKVWEKKNICLHFCCSLDVVCFNKRFVEVTEGKTVDLSVSVSRQLSRSISVKLIYEEPPFNPATSNGNNGKLYTVHHIAQNYAF